MQPCKHPIHTSLWTGQKFEDLNLQLFATISWGQHTRQMQYVTEFQSITFQQIYTSRQNYVTFFTGVAFEDYRTIWHRTIWYKDNLASRTICQR